MKICFKFEILALLLFLMSVVPVFSTEQSLNIQINEMLNKNYFYSPQENKFDSSFFNKKSILHLPVDQNLHFALLDHSKSRKEFSCNNCPNISSGFDSKDGLKFNGLDSRIVGNATVPISNQNYAISVWVKIDSQKDNGIIGWGNFGFNDQVNALKIDNLGSIQNMWWGNDLSTQNSIISVGNWYHIVAQFDGSKRSIYVNGDEIVSDTPSSILNVPSNTDFEIGRICPSCAGNHHFNGSIDNLYIFNHSLSDFEINLLHTETSPLFSRGIINVSNIHSNETLTDIFIQFNTSKNILRPFHQSLNSEYLSDSIFQITVPKLESNEESLWEYVVLDERADFLSVNTSYDKTRVFVNENVTITDTLSNIGDTCLYNINLTQKTLEIPPFSNFYFNALSTLSSDLGNISYVDNKTQYWNVLGGNCLNPSNSISANYSLLAPSYGSSVSNRPITGTQISFDMNTSISNISIHSIFVSGEYKVDLFKESLNYSTNSLSDPNITWRVFGNISTSSNLNYVLRNVSLWVSEKNISNNATNPENIEGGLEVIYSPNTILNSSTPWSSPEWLFNYTSDPRPITWIATILELDDDGTQLVNSSTSVNNNVYLNKQLFVIGGYWLEVLKNVTSLSNSSYSIKVKIKNKGNEATPSNAIVTAYEFIPSEFNVSDFKMSNSSWFSVATSNTTINGDNLNGTLFSFALIPSNNLNASFTNGLVENENNTLYIEYNVTGSGIFKPNQLYLSGLDPQRVEGGSASNKIKVKDIYSKEYFGNFNYLMYLAILLTGIIVLI